MTINDTICTYQMMMWKQKTTIDVEVGVFSSQTEQKPVTFTWFINGNDVTNESWAMQIDC